MRLPVKAKNKGWTRTCHAEQWLSHTQVQSYKNGQQSIKKKQKQETYWRLEMTRLKPLAFPLIGCYGSDGGGSGNGRCGHHMRSPVKKKSWQS